MRYINFFLFFCISIFSIKGKAFICKEHRAIEVKRTYYQNYFSWTGLTEDDVRDCVSYIVDEEPGPDRKFNNFTDILNQITKVKETPEKRIICEAANNWLYFTYIRRAYDSALEKIRSIGCDIPGVEESLKTPTIENLIRILELQFYLSEDFARDGWNLYDYLKKLSLSIEPEDIDPFIEVLISYDRQSVLKKFELKSLANNYIKYVFEQKKDKPNYLEAARKFMRWTTYRALVNNTLTINIEKRHFREWLDFLFSLGLDLDAPMNFRRNNKPWDIDGIDEMYSGIGYYQLTFRILSIASLEHLHYHPHLSKHDYALTMSEIRPPDDQLYALIALSVRQGFYELANKYLAYYRDIQKEGEYPVSHGFGGNTGGPSNLYQEPDRLRKFLRFLPEREKTADNEHLGQIVSSLFRSFWVSLSKNKKLFNENLDILREHNIPIDEMSLNGICPFSSYNGMRFDSLIEFIRMFNFKPSNKTPFARCFSGKIFSGYSNPGLIEFSLEMRKIGFPNAGKDIAGNLTPPHYKTYEEKHNEFITELEKASLPIPEFWNFIRQREGKPPIDYAGLIRAGKSQRSAPAIKQIDINGRKLLIEPNRINDYARGFLNAFKGKETGSFPIDEAALALLKKHHSDQFSPSLSLSEVSVFLSDFRQTSIDPRNLKLVLESKIEETYLDEKIKYNAASTNLLSLFSSGRLQCSSGTATYSIARSLSKVRKAREEPVVIFTHGHVLPGQLVYNSSSKSWSLYGIEMTGSGESIVKFGETSQINIPIMVIRESDYYISELLAPGIADLKGYITSVISQMKSDYGFSKAFGEEVKFLDNLSKDRSLNQSIFGFGTPMTQSGDQSRSTNSQLNIEMYRQQPPSPFDSNNPGGTVKGDGSDWKPLFPDMLMKDDFSDFFNFQIFKRKVLDGDASLIILHKEFEDIVFDHELKAFASLIGFMTAVSETKANNCEVSDKVSLSKQDNIGRIVYRIMRENLVEQSSENSFVDLFYNLGTGETIGVCIR